MANLHSIACFAPLLLVVTGLLFVGNIHVVESAQDLTLTPDATGCEVAKAAYDKLLSSLIFKKNEQFIMPRAALCSKFGNDIYVSGAVGIWQMTQANLDKSKDILVELNITANITKILCIEYDKATLEDLRKPLFNAVAVALLIARGGGGTVPMRGSVDDQKTFWKTSTGADLTNFEQAAETLDKNDGSQDTQCFQCTMAPSDVVIIVDDSGSVNNEEWGLELLFVEKVLEQIKDAMADGSTQASGTIFSTDVNQMAFTSDYQSVLDFYHNAVRKEGKTMIPLTLDKTAELVQNDPNSRLWENDIKKIVFFLTDGQSTTYDTFDSSCINLKRLPLEIYAIGTMANAKMVELQKISSHPNYARRYTTFDEFKNDIPSIILQGCKTGTALGGTNNVASGSGPTQVNQTEFTVVGMQAGETRYFSIPFQTGTVSNFKVSPTQLDMAVWISFNNEYPSEANYDFKDECVAGTECSILVKDPAQFLNDVCQQVNVVMEQETYNAAVTATGGSGTEDVPGSITIKEDVVSNWEDYSEADELFTDQAMQHYNQSIRWAMAILNYPIRQYVVLGLIIVSTLYR